MKQPQKNDSLLPVLENINQADRVYCLTLESDIKKTDRIKFDAKLNQLVYWLNDYCYGKQFKKSNKRINIIGGFEVGSMCEMPHYHLVLYHEKEMEKSYQELNAFIRKSWYKLLEAKGSIMGSLVKFEPADNNEAWFNYSLKEVNPRNFETLLWL